MIDLLKRIFGYGKDTKEGISLIKSKKSTFVDLWTLEQAIDMVDNLSSNYDESIDLTNDNDSILIQKQGNMGYYLSFYSYDTEYGYKDVILSKNKVRENIIKFYGGEPITKNWMEDIYTNATEATVRRKRGRKTSFGSRNYIIRYITSDGSEAEINVYEPQDTDVNFYSGDGILIEDNGVTAKITNLVTGKSITGAIE